VEHSGNRSDVYSVFVGKREGKNHLEGSSGQGCVEMDWMELAADRDRWRALSNTVMNLRVP